MPQVAAIGEVLLDLIPTGARLGGTPASLAWYFAEMGARGWLVSAVGQDKHGLRVLRELERKGLSPEFVFVKEDAATGEARVHFDENGKASYHFLDDVAWDGLQMTPPLLALASRLDGVVFTTLAQRGEKSRRAIYEFLDHTAPDAVRLFDLHLRAPYYSDEVFEQSFRRATAAKMSASELPALARWLGKEGASAENACRALLEKYPNLKLAALTRGDEGSLIFDRDGVHECGGFYADRVANTSGSGDVFAAVLCMGLLNGADMDAVNEEANRAACCVCAEPEALVPLSDEVLDGLQKAHII